MFINEDGNIPEGIVGGLTLRAKKRTLYRLISQMIENTYCTSQNQTKLDEYLKDSIRNLKKINLIETRSKIELEKYNHTELPNFLYQEKINQTLRFFVSVIGLIDKHIDFLKCQIEFYSISDNEEHIEELESACSKQMLLQTIKKDVVTEFKKRNIQHGEEISEKELETTPSDNFFTELQYDTTRIHSQLHLQKELISSYDIGYTSFGRCNFDNIIDLYEGLIRELKQYEHLNDIKLDSVRNKVILRSIRRKNG